MYIVNLIGRQDPHHRGAPVSPKKKLKNSIQPVLALKMHLVHASPHICSENICYIFGFGS